MIEKSQENTEGRDFFVGDIHGQMDLLDEAMKRVDFDKKRDRLFSVGDLIDRGAKSYDALSLPFEPWFYGVRGNHELMAADAFVHHGKAFELWMMNGGTWALIENMKEVSQILGEALKHLPYAREIEIAGKRVGMVHAEPPPDWALIEGTSLMELVWGRRRINAAYETPVQGIDAVIVGHTPVREPVCLGNVHYIDTGAFHTGNLTLIEAKELLG